VQALQLQLLDQDPAVAVNDRLRQPGGAGGEQDPERMADRPLLEPELPGRYWRMIEDLGPCQRAGHGRHGSPRIQVGQPDHLL
jgi:hypothetical protein